MAEPTLGITRTELDAAIGRYMGFDTVPANWSASNLADVASVRQMGLSSFYGVRAWSFLSPLATINLWVETDAVMVGLAVYDWPDTTGTLNGQPVKDNGTSTVTAIAATFHPTMVGASIIFDTSGNDYVIASYVDSKNITVTGDASAETSGDGFSIAATGAGTETSLVTALTDTFYPEMVGHTITFDDTGNSYVIATYINALSVTVTGDAGGETTDDPFTVEADENGNYRLPDDYGSPYETRIWFPAETGYAPMVIMDYAAVRERQRNSVSVGVPLCAALIPVANTGAAGQRWNLMVSPPPDALYQCRHRYNILRDDMGAAEYPAGGSAHRNTLILACLDAAITLFHKNPEQDAKISQAYKRALVASIRKDAELGPAYLGFPNAGAGEQFDRTVSVMNYPEGYGP